MINMIKIRFSERKCYAMLAHEHRDERPNRKRTEGKMVKKNKVHVMTCGASAVIVDEDGMATTSVDMLVNGVKKLLSRNGRRKTA